MNRKRAHVGVFLTLLVVSSVSFVAATAQRSPVTASDDWPGHRADLGRTGSTTDSGPAPYATEDWNMSFGARAESVPAVANGTAYASVTTDADLPATGRIVAYDTANGERRWTSKKVGAAIGSSAVADGTVYVSTRGTHHDGYEDYGGLYALDADTGDEKWTHETPAGHLSAPTAGNDTVYVAGKFFSKLEDTDDIVRPAVPAVYALDANDGDERWNYSIREAGYLTPYSPVVADGKAYVTVREWKSVYSDESELYALESSDEKPPRDHQVAEDKPENPRVTIETAPKDAENRIFEENQTDVLRANASTAENDEILRYEWDVDGDGEFERSGKKITVGTDFCGERTVTVRVVDDDRLTEEDSVTLTRG